MLKILNKKLYTWENRPSSLPNSCRALDAIDCISSFSVFSPREVWRQNVLELSMDKMQQQLDMERRFHTSFDLWISRIVFEQTLLYEKLYVTENENRPRFQINKFQTNKQTTQGEVLYSQVEKPLFYRIIWVVRPITSSLLSVVESNTFVS